MILFRDAHFSALSRYIREGGVSEAGEDEQLLSNAVASLMKDLERLDPAGEDAYYQRIEQNKLIRILIETLIQ